MYVFISGTSPCLRRVLIKSPLGYRGEGIHQSTRGVSRVPSKGRARVRRRRRWRVRRVPRRSRSCFRLCWGGVFVLSAPPCCYCNGRCKRDPTRMTLNFMHSLPLLLCSFSQLGWIHQDVRGWRGWSAARGGGSGRVYGRENRSLPLHLVWGSCYRHRHPHSSDLFFNCSIRLIAPRHSSSTHR